MIQANELRVGNKINRGTISEIMIVSDEANNREAQHAFEVYENPSVWIYTNEAEPISLTPDILEKCGFVKSKLDRIEYQYLQLSSDERFLQVNDGVYYGIMGVANYHWVKQPCKYLHQLQNLYFSLTGEELTVQL